MVIISRGHFLGQRPRDTRSLGRPDQKKKLGGQDKPPVSPHCPGQFRSGLVLQMDVEKANSDFHDVP